MYVIWNSFNSTIKDNMMMNKTATWYFNNQHICLVFCFNVLLTCALNVISTVLLHGKVIEI